MDLKQIEYFVRVADLGSFTRASIALRVAQPTLSRQVRLLEVELHQHLLKRNGRGATLTDAGQRMLEHGRGILHQVERAREDLSRLHGIPVGAVALGLPPSLARLLAVPLARIFRTQWPQARLSITEGLSLTMQDALRDGRLDLALLYGAPGSAELEGEYLCDEELFAIAPRPTPAARTPADTANRPITAPLSLPELAQCPLVIPTRPNALRMRLERHLANAGLHPHIAMEVDGVPALLELAAEGVGLAILPAHAIHGATQIKRFTLRRIGSGLMEQIWLAASASRARTPTQQALMKLLRTQVARLHAHTHGHEQP
jgi:LysR family nitrogen assimilation transcriptional regulator